MGAVFETQERRKLQGWAFFNFYQSPFS